MRWKRASSIDSVRCFWGTHDEESWQKNRYDIAKDCATSHVPCYASHAHFQPSHSYDLAVTTDVLDAAAAAAAARIQVARHGHQSICSTDQITADRYVVGYQPSACYLPITCANWTSPEPILPLLESLRKNATVAHLTIWQTHAQSKRIYRLPDSFTLHVHYRRNVELSRTGLVCQ